MKHKLKKQLKRNKHANKKAAHSKKIDLSVETYFDQIVPIFFKKLTDADGCCYDPHGRNPRIIIDSRLLTKRKLNVIIEEITHAFFWDLPEYKVRKFSAQLGKILHHLFLKR